MTEIQLPTAHDSERFWDALCDFLEQAWPVESAVAWTNDLQRHVRQLPYDDVRQRPSLAPYPWMLNRIDDQGVRFTAARKRSSTAGSIRPTGIR